MINIILPLLLLIVIFILLILIIPIKYTLVTTYHEKLRYSFRISSGFLVESDYNKQQDEKAAMQIRIFGIALPLKKFQKNVTDKKQEKQKPNSNKRNSWFRLIRSFLENHLHISSWEAFKKLFSMFSPDSIIITGRCGFYEPEYTAFMLIVSSVLNGFKEAYTINLNPVWDDDYLELYAHIGGSVIPALLLFHLLKFILQGSTLRFLAEMKKTKKSHHKAAVQPI